MAKDKIAFVCSNCGQESAKWMGKCPSCGQWNTFKEIRIAADSGSQAAKNAGMTMRHGGAATMFGGQHSEHDAAPMKLRDISAIDEPRIDMRDEELNRVLGGGTAPCGLAKAEFHLHRFPDFRNNHIHCNIHNISYNNRSFLSLLY